MLGYAIALAVKLKYGFRTFLDEHVIHQLKQFSKNPTGVESLSKICSDEFPWDESYGFPITEFELRPALSKGKAINYLPIVSIASFLLIDPIILRHIGSVGVSDTFMGQLIKPGFFVQTSI